MMRKGAFLLALTLALAHQATAGLALSQKTLRSKTKVLEISIRYPKSDVAAIDSVLAHYAQRSFDQFKHAASDHLAAQPAYTLDTTYKVVRNDGKMFAVLFTEFSYAGGAHPNTQFTTFNFLLPDGAQVFLAEILEGPRGITRVSKLATSTLLGRVASGPEAISDRDWLARGAGPSAANFKDFVWLPDRLRIYFPPYQVAPYVAGPLQVDIALAQLKDVIRTDWRAPAPSFDCAKATSRIEGTICADAVLARLDREVAEIYQDQQVNLYSQLDRVKLQASQRAFLATRDRTCVGVAPNGCLKRLYRTRLAELAP